MMVENVMDQNAQAVYFPWTVILVTVEQEKVVI